MAVEGGGGNPESGMELLRYETLRHMVLADDAEGLRVASVHWASMHKELEQRVNTIEIAIHRLDKVWRGTGGRTALAKYRQALEVMQSAMWTAKSNAENIGGAYDALVKAQKDMRALDGTPNKATQTPNPQPGGTEAYAWDLDSRQPAAYGIAKNLSYAYAWAGAGYSPLTDSYDSSPWSGTRSGDGTGDSGPTSPSGGGPGRPRANADGTRPRAIITRGRPGDGQASGPALGGPRPPKSGVRAPAAGLQPDPGSGAAPGGAPGFGVPGGAPRDPGSSGARRGSFGSSGGRGSTGTGAGRVRFGGSNPGGKTLGGGMRPAADPVEPGILPGEPGVASPGEHGQIPPGGMPGSVVGGHGSRKSRRTSGYERGEPDMFVDHRQANAAGGAIRQPGTAKSFDAMPGMLGSQKHRRAEDDDHSQWELPATTPTPEGFPDTVEDSKFTRRDGVQFEVRRRKGGA